MQVLYKSKDNELLLSTESANGWDAFTVRELERLIRTLQKIRRHMLAEQAINAERFEVKPK